jgi:hypothetical protein
MMHQSLRSDENTWEKKSIKMHRPAKQMIMKVKNRSYPLNEMSELNIHCTHGKEEHRVDHIAWVG